MKAQVATLVNRLGRTVYGMQFSCGLNPAQWDALRYVARANRYSRMPSALARYLGTTKGTVSQTLKALECKGLVRKERPEGVDCGDRRAVMIEITDEGQALLRRDPLRCIEDAAGACGDLEATTQALRGLVKALQNTQGQSEFGVCANCCHLCSPCAPDKADDSTFVCGLTREPLSPDEIEQICVSYRCPSS